MPNLTLALDRSARRIDADGRLHVDRSHISKAAVNPYYGLEIPGFESLGLEADRVYRLFRDPVELERAAPSFARIPILSKHIPVTAQSVTDDPELKKLVVGAIGSEVTFSAPYLDADLCIWDAAAIAGIDTDKVRELSCAYRYVPVMTPGNFQGQAYDGIMTEIQANHLALVEVGRAGSDVIVADKNPFIDRNPAMKMSKLGKALFAALCAASPVLAADSALPALVGSADRKTFKKAEVKEKLMALDASIDSTKLDAVLDAILDVEQEPKATETPAAAADESPADKVRKMLAGKVDDSVISEICAMMQPAAAADESEPGMKKEEVKAAMDSAMEAARKDWRDATEAARDVRPVVGDVAMDSAAEIYGFALDHMKVDRKDVTGVPALRALFKVAATAKNAVTTAPTVAQDSAGLKTKFPNAARFGKA